MKPILGLINDQPSSIVDFIRSVLGRVNIVPEPFDLPEGQGYIYATFCVPLMIEGCEQFGYVGSSIRDFRTYRGSGTHPDFQHSLEHVPPAEWVKVCLGVYPVQNLGRMEKMTQRALGIRGAFRDDGHPPWWNKRAYGGSFRDLHADPVFAAANAERMRRRNADPKFAAARDERTRRLHADPVFAAANAERMRRLYADPVWKANHLADLRAAVARVLGTKPDGQT